MSSTLLLEKGGEGRVYAEATRSCVRKYLAVANNVHYIVIFLKKNTIIISSNRKDKQTITSRQMPEQVTSFSYHGNITGDYGRNETEIENRKGHTI